LRTCPSDEELLACLRAVASTDAQTRVRRQELEAHLQSCQACCRRVERLSAATVAQARPSQTQSVLPRGASAAAGAETRVAGPLDPTGKFLDRLAAAPPPLVGSPTVQEAPPRIEGYQIIGELGRGGMGVVYKARQVKLDRIVAIKMPRLSGTDPSVRQRFLREARLAAQISNPNLCAIHDVGEVDGTPYFSMPFLDGQPLSKLLDKPWPQARAAMVICKIALAVQELHDRQVIHRDLKPGNIMVRGNGEPIVMDFGLAKSLRIGATQLTVDNSVLGTPAYMPLEQVTNDVSAIGPGTDIYSLGAVLYEMLTAHRPRAGDAYQAIAEIMSGELTAPSHWRAEMDPALETICLKAMARKAQDRFPSMKAFAEALKRCVKGQAGAMKEARGDERARERVAPATVERVVPLAPTMLEPVAERAPKILEGETPLASAVQSSWKAVILLAAGLSLGVFVLVVVAGGGVIAWFNAGSPGGTSSSQSRAAASSSSFDASEHGSATSVGSASGSQDPDLLLERTFSSEGPHDETFPNEAEGVKDGKFYHSFGAKHGSSGPTIPYSCPPVRDYEVTLRVRLTKARIWVLLPRDGNKSTCTHWAVMIASNGELDIHRDHYNRVGAEWQEVPHDDILTDGEKNRIGLIDREGKWAELRIVRNGAHLRVEVDGRPIIEVAEPTSPPDDYEPLQGNLLVWPLPISDEPALFECEYIRVHRLKK
jgi:serine/threonine protein kinase